MTPLHWAAEKGHTAIVTLLLERGADVNVKNNVILVLDIPINYNDIPIIIYISYMIINILIIIIGWIYSSSLGSS